MPDPIVDAVGLRAVRAKVHAEASTVCPNCGLRHLLDNHCSAAPDVVHNAEPSPVEAPGGAASPHAHAFVAAAADPSRRAEGGGSSSAHLDGRNEATGTGADAAVERDDTRARRLVGSLITFLGLDPASFGEVDDGTPSPAVAATRVHTPEWLWREPADVRQPSVGPPSPRMRRVINFFGFDVGADATAPDGHVIAEPATVLTENGEPAPEDQTAPTDSPTELEAPDSRMVATADCAPPQSWRRADDDILYRPSRRPRSPRRAWRDRVASRE